MSEFLKNLKAGQEKRTGRRRNYQGIGKYKSNGKRGDVEQRSILQSQATTSDYIQVLLVEVLPLFQNFFEGIIENQRRMLAIEESRAQSIESFNEYLKDMMNFGFDTLQNLTTSLESTNIKLPKKRKYTKKFPTKERRRVLKTIMSMRRNGATYETIALHLDKEKIPTFSRRGKWHAQTVHRLLQDNS